MTILFLDDFTTPPFFPFGGLGSPWVNAPNSIFAGDISHFQKDPGLLRVRDAGASGSAMISPQVTFNPDYAVELQHIQFGPTLTGFVRFGIRWIDNFPVGNSTGYYVESAYADSIGSGHITATVGVRPSGVILHGPTVHSVGSITDVVMSLEMVGTQIIFRIDGTQVFTTFDTTIAAANTVFLNMTNAAASSPSLQQFSIGSTAGLSDNLFYRSMPP